MKLLRFILPFILILCILCTYTGCAEKETSIIALAGSQWEYNR